MGKKIVVKPGDELVVNAKDFPTLVKKEPVPAQPMEFFINRLHIWPSGEIGIVTLRKQNTEINLTIEQAKSLANVIQTKLAE